MSDLNLAFSRALLTDVLKEVKPHVTKNELRLAWVWSGDRRLWEFHGPQDFYWYGRASNAYDARAKGWQAWLEREKRKKIIVAET